MSHEIVAAMAGARLPLCRTLEEMLDEHVSHCTERRGCGYTQATRFLATHINQPASAVLAADLSIFANWSQSHTEVVARQLVEAGWARGWRCADRIPDAVVEKLPASSMLQDLRTLLPRVREVSRKVAYVESKLFLDLVIDLLSRDRRQAPEVTGMSRKPIIGSCSQAEEFFLEIAHNRIRRGGRVNIIVDAENRPLMVEKMQLGESHSGMVVSPVRIFGVSIPPGSLCALDYPDELPGARATRNGGAIALADLREARFLRLTTMAIPPRDRLRAFGQQFKSQLRANMLSPGDTTIDQLRQFANDELSALQ